MFRRAKLPVGTPSLIFSIWSPAPPTHNPTRCFVLFFFSSTSALTNHVTPTLSWFIFFSYVPTIFSLFCFCVLFSICTDSLLLKQILLSNLRHPHYTFAFYSVWSPSWCFSYRIRVPYHKIRQPANGASVILIFLISFCHSFRL